MTYPNKSTIPNPYLQIDRQGTMQLGPMLPDAHLILMLLSDRPHTEIHLRSWLNFNASRYQQAINQLMEMGWIDYLGSL
jgi:hypothetical protein